MKVIVDECIAKSTRLLLMEAKYDLVKVEQVLGSGAEDNEIYEYLWNAFF